MSCVYIIRHKHSNNSYIGSTTDFDKRMKDHIYECKYVRRQLRLYEFIHNNGGWDNFDMVKVCDCDEEERNKMEQYHINFIKPTLNSMKSYQSENEWKEYQKRVCNEYYEKNRDKIRRSQKEYYDKNKKLQKTPNCECGGFVSKRNKARHLKTNLHRSYLQHHYQNHQT